MIRCLDYIILCKGDSCHYARQLDGMGGLMCTVKVILFASCFGFDTGFAISWFGFENNVYLCDTL